MKKFQLHFVWQTGRDPIDVVFARVTPLRLKKELMGSLIREFYDLVLNRRAIPRAGPLDKPGIQWRPMQIGPNDFVCLARSVSDPARQLFHVELAVPKKIQCKNLVFSERLRLTM